MKYILLLVVVIMIILAFIYEKKENFTAPSLKLNSPPSWFPQNSAEVYNKEKWHVNMYLDRYYIDNNMASVYRFWRN